jgi:hypothetical protein
MRASFRRRSLAIAAVASLASVFAIAFGNARFTHYLESEQFRASLENETAEGLHFPGGRYAPIRRAGFLTATSEHFQAQDGRKAMQALDAHGIAAKFNPLGLFLRRWQFDDVHVQSGTVQIHIYKAVPEASPSKPWFSAILPNRVYLKRIETETADVTWQFRGKPAGFFGTRLLITPRGRDFEYVATGGRLKMALLPNLDLRGAHLLITKTLLTVYDVDLVSNSGSEGSIHAQANAGLGKNKNIDFRATFDHMPIRPWLPATWTGRFDGSASGEVHWLGENPKLESSSGEGGLSVRNARIDNFPPLEKLAQLAQKKSFEHLELNDCSFRFAWRYPEIDLKEIAIEEKGEFRIEGSILINHRSLDGAIQLGLPRQYLDWLPNPEEVFSRERSGYLWTTVHLSGTIDEPKQDLSPRIVELFKESPGAYLGLLFRQFEGWLKKVFGAD